MVFASSPITFLYDDAGKRTVKAVKPFSGVLRFALVPPPADDSGVTGTGFPGIHDGVQLSSSSGVKRLDISRICISSCGTCYVGVSEGREVPTASCQSSPFQFCGGGGSEAVMAVGAPSTNMPRLSSNLILYQWPMQSRINGSKFRHSQLLMLESTTSCGAKDGLQYPEDEQFDLEYHCIKGRMIPVVGTSWQYQETLPSLGFDDDDALTQIATMDGGVRQTILDQVKKDLVRVLPTFDENVYGFGKQVARLAQLVHISYMLSSPSAQTKTIKPTRRLQRMRRIRMQHSYRRDWTRCAGFLCTFLRDGQKDTLMFDSQFGGITTKDGLEDTQADFGNGRFNVSPGRFDHFSSYCVETSISV